VAVHVGDIGSVDNAAIDNGTVICQVEGPDGRLTTVGSFQLSGGYGYWGSPDPVTNGQVTGARLITTTGTVLATATFPAQPPAVDSTGLEAFTASLAAVGCVPR
jgi:hypothetical protein